MIRQHNVTQMATARVIDDLGAWLATIEVRYDIPAHATLTRRFDATRPPELGRAWSFSWDWQADDPETEPTILSIREVRARNRLPGR